MIIIDALQSVFTIFIMIGLGYYLTKKGWFDHKISELFSKLVTKVSLPAFMISNLLSSFTKERLTQSLMGLFIPFLSMLIMYFISFIIIKVINIEDNKKGTFSAMFSLSNTIFIGLPINISLFGEQAMPYILLYYIVNTLIFWTVGIFGIKKDSGLITSNILNKESLKNIFSPPLITFIFSIILILLNIKLPKSIMDSCKYIGNLTTPISTMFIGITLSSLNLKEIKLDKKSSIILIARFILSPITVLILCSFIKIPVLMEKVFIIESAMPVMMQIAIVSRAYESDYEYATVMAALSTAASLIFIPIYMIIFSYIF